MNMDVSARNETRQHGKWRYHIQVRLKRVLRTEGSAAGIGRDTPDAGSEGIVSSSDRVPGLQNTFQCCGW
jgi:hypothetical protein